MAHYAIEHRALGAVIAFFIVHLVCIISYIWMWHVLRDDDEKSLLDFFKFYYWKINPLSGICNMLTTAWFAACVFFVICTIKYGFR